MFRFCRNGGRGEAVALALALCVTVYAPGIWWGLPSVRAWAADEIRPPDVRAGIHQHFAGGWNERYPPLQYYLLALLYTPLLPDAPPDVPVPQLDQWRLFLLGRALTVLMAGGLLFTVHQTSREHDGHVAARATTLVAGLMPPMAYYAKLVNLDVPCLMWFALSMRYYLRLHASPRARDLYLFALTATLAICTKDQAYGFYVLPAAALAVRCWRYGPAHGHPHPPAPHLRRPLIGAALLAGILFGLLHNVVRNAEGFALHVGTILGPASSSYRMFAPTATGQAGLLAETLRQLRGVLGWPAALAVLAGLASACHRTSRRRLAWLLLPILSYYLTFLAPIGYVFDRFLLGPGLLLALPAGRWLAARWVDRTRAVWMRPLLCAGGALAFSVAISVSLLMMQDGRYATEHWLRTGLPANAEVIAIGQREYLPRPEQRDWEEFAGDTNALAARRPDAIVVNMDYARRFTPEMPRGPVVAGLAAGTLGYQLAYVAPARPRWLPLRLEPWYLKPGEDLFTNLDKISPETAVYCRTGFLRPP